MPTTDKEPAAKGRPTLRPSQGTDRFSPEKRSRIMASVRSKNTKPEMTVRSWLHRNGYRFRLHRKDLPGSPDVVLPKHRLAVFVNGCFWHQHDGCRKATLPKKNREEWRAKLLRNVERDREAVTALEDRGWRALVLWECETKGDMAGAISKLDAALR